MSGQRLVAVWLLVAALAFFPFPRNDARAEPSPYGVSETGLAAHGLPVIETPALRLYHTPGAEAEARGLAQTMSAAVSWYRARFDWEHRLVVAVLDQDDWKALTHVPYPVPFAQMLWDVVVMPDSITAFPGFERWNLPPRALNEALTFHEIGHILANRLGIRSGNHFIEELVANIYLAAYIRAERPDLTFILDGLPAGFDTGMAHRHLIDLDDLYSGVGLVNYAWYQFRLAALADFMVARAALAEIVAGLREAFPDDGWRRRETISASLSRLEAIVPGVSALAADMLGESTLPRLSPQACSGDMAAEAIGEVRTLFVENRSDSAFSYRIPALVREVIELDLQIDALLLDEDPDKLEGRIEAAYQEVIESESGFEVLEPGRVVRHKLLPRSLIEIASGTCATMPGHDARLVVDQLARGPKPSSLPTDRAE